MNDGYSVSTERLRSLSDNIKSTVDSFRDTYVPKIEYLTISSDELPMLDGGFSGAYDNLQDATSQAAEALCGNLDSVHGELKKVVERYEELEEAHGTDFDESLVN